MKGQGDRSQPDFVAVTQWPGNPHRIVADKRAISAAQILEPRLRTRHVNGRVTSRDFGQIDADGRSDLATENVQAFRKRDVTPVPPDPTCDGRAVSVGRQRFCLAAERVPVRMHRAQEPLVARAIVERGPDLVDERAQACVGDKRSGPDARMEVVLAQRPRTILDEDRQ